MYRSPICIIPLLLAVTACTNTSPDVNPPSDSDDMRVSFGTYVERNGYSQTRATDATANDIVNNISTAERLRQVGFGVFAYYTDNQAYDDVKATAKPNFFWNQQVTYDATNGWTLFAGEILAQRAWLTSHQHRQRSDFVLCLRPILQGGRHHGRRRDRHRGLNRHHGLLSQLSHGRPLRQL